jgi:hypothetical protein
LLTSDSLQEATDFFILDNSLRETTVGVPRGHTLGEKHEIGKAMAATGIDGVILGSFGSKIAVDSQIGAFRPRMTGLEYAEKTQDARQGRKLASHARP